MLRHLESLEDYAILKAEFFPAMMFLGFLDDESLAEAPEGFQELRNCYGTAFHIRLAKVRVYFMTGSELRRE